MAVKVTRVKDPVVDKVLSELRAEINRLGRAATAASSGGIWELVERRVLTAPATEVEFRGLRGNTDIEYRITGFVRDDGGVSSAIELRPNGSTSGVRGQILSGIGTSATAASQGVIIVGRTRADGEVATFEGTFYARAGSIRPYQGIGSNQDVTTPNIFAEVYAGHWSNTTDEITSLVLVAPNNGFGTHSDFALFRRAA